MRKFMRSGLFQRKRRIVLSSFCGIRHKGPWGKKEISVGREESNDVVISGPLYSTVSREHCTVSEVEGGYNISDYSSNGTLVNMGDKVLSSPGGSFFIPYPFQGNRDIYESPVIKLGEASFYLDVEEASLLGIAIANVFGGIFPFLRE
ncbi:FHA domain-containing protein [Candidatus Pacearchaeota archaeon]|nr:FHA domain-containing protein [Candidatus Pacearchaeota archaeon]MBD3283448.1 FHA domain-containing protein [Candidatus Pacearchaeota archaeon]